MKGLTKPISMIMCVYNEESNIKNTILEYYNEIYKHLPQGSEYIIYLDKPTDQSPAIIKDLSNKIPITVIEGEINLGYAGATKTALQATKNNIIFYSDSSGKHSAKDFWNLIPYTYKYDIVSGLRSHRNDPFIRKFISFLQRLMISLLFLVPFHDFNTGYKIIRRNIISDVLDDCKYMKQSFSSELLIRAHSKNFSIKDVPVSFFKRKSKEKGTKYLHLPGIILNSFIGYVLLRLELLFK